MSVCQVLSMCSFRASTFLEVRKYSHQSQSGQRLWKSLGWICSPTSSRFVFAGDYEYVFGQTRQKKVTEESLFLESLVNNLI